jgi:hypothetical protein
MDDLLRFLGVMSALSASATTMTGQLKRRFQFLQFDNPSEKALMEEDGKLVELKEGKFHANVHLICGLNGAILAAIGDIHPLSFLQIQPIWHYGPQGIANFLDYVTAGIMVAYGGPWFHEMLGVLRAYKQSLRGAR